jgi:hypothetical protein
MSKPQDVFGSYSPKSALNKPLFHVQDKVGVGVASQTFVLGMMQRNLNTVITNQIPGASLGTNSVNLPAGTYYIDGSAILYDASGYTAKAVITDNGGNVLLQGPNIGVYTSKVTPVSGNITLSSAVTIKLQQFTVTASSENCGSAASSIYPEIYSDLKIWQLDTTIQTPVLVSDKLFPLPGNCMVTGNMHGLEYVKNAANQVSIYPGICMDSLNTTMLTLSNQQNLNLPTTVSTIFNLFLCNDGVVRYDTDVNGANLSTYKIRWFGFVRNNAAGTICGFTMSGNWMQFTKASENVITSVVVTTYTQFDHSAMIPTSRISEIQYGVRDASVSESIYASDDGTNTLVIVGTTATTVDDTNVNVWGSTGSGTVNTFNPNRYFKTQTSTTDLLCKSVRMRR